MAEADGIDLGEFAPVVFGIMIEAGGMRKVKGFNSEAFCRLPGRW